MRTPQQKPQDPASTQAKANPSTPLNIDEIYNQRLKLLIRIAFLATAGYSVVSFYNQFIGRMGTDILAGIIYLSSEYLRRKPGYLDFARVVFMLGLGVSFFITPMFGGHFDSGVGWLYGLIPLATSHIYGPRGALGGLIMALAGLFFVAEISPQLPVVQEVALNVEFRISLVVTSIVVFGAIAVSSASSLRAQLSQLREASLALIRSRAEVDAATYSKGVFLANMSHEIRTPMNGILGMLQELKKKEQPGDYDALFNTAWESGNRLLDTLNNILDFSKMEAGKLSLLELEFQPGSVFARIDRNFSSIAQGKGVELRMRVPKSCPALVGDETRFEQLLSILVDNAIRFSDDGVVSVEIEATPSSDSKSCDYHFIVRDQGPGISIQAQERLFSEFESLEERNDHRSGIGLGLALAKHLVELMNGNISVSSELGQGTAIRFDLTMPLANSKPHQTGVLDDLDVAISVLVVDDDSINRRVATLALERLGCQVQQATDGFVAERTANACAFDLILMDLHMPGQSGIKTAKHILQSEGPSAHARIVAFSGDTDARSVDAAMEAGMHDVLAKPFRHEQLLQMIARQRHFMPPKRAQARAA